MGEIVLEGCRIIRGAAPYVCDAASGRRLPRLKLLFELMHGLAVEVGVEVLYFMLSCLQASERMETRVKGDCIAE